MPPDILNQVGLPPQAVVLLPRFLKWYFWDHLIVIFRNWMLYASAFRESFSIFFLIKTLFAPWKSIKDSYPTKGFNFQAIIEVLFLNITARGIGAVIRLAAIVTGLLIQIGLIIGFAVYFLFWVTFPLFVVSVPLYMVLAFFQ